MHASHRLLIVIGPIHLHRLLLSPNEDVREQSLWALSNVAGDSVIHRELLLALDIVNVLTESQRVMHVFVTVVLFLDELNH
jgi:hypothetical protein